MAELGLRLIFSLLMVVGLLLLIARLANRRFQAGGDAPVRVVSRQSLTRGSAVAVVTVGARVLVVGTTEHQVTLLAEVEPDEVGLDAEDVEVAVADAGVGAASEFAGLVARSAAIGPGAHRAAGPRRRPGGRRAAPGTGPAQVTGPLAGSVLSPQTWRQAIRAVTPVSGDGTRRAS